MAKADRTPEQQELIESGAGANKKFKAFDPHAVMLAPRPWMSGCPTVIWPDSSRI